MTNTNFGDIFKTNTAAMKDAAILDNTIPSDEIVEIAPERCVNWKYSDRQNFEMGDLHALADDIEQHGQVQPILVRKTVENKYEVIAGERRWRACLLLNKSVKAVIADLDDQQAFLVQCSENKKEGISPYSRSLSYSKIIKDEKITQNELAKKLGIKKSTFSELMAFNYVPKELWLAVNDMSKLSVSTASYIRSILNDDHTRLSDFLKYATNIRKGVGKQALSKLINQQPQPIKIDYYSKDKRKIFTCSNNSITFTDDVVKKIAVTTLCDRVANILDHMFE